jgi:hypothetical protein
VDPALEKKEMVRYAAHVFARRALPMLPRYSPTMRELIDHIEEWLITFDEGFLEENLPIWVDKEGER